MIAHELHVGDGAISDTKIQFSKRGFSENKVLEEHDFDNPSDYSTDHTFHHIKVC